MIHYHTREELEQEIRKLRGLFDLVRVVNPVDSQILMSGDKSGVSSVGCTCYCVWGRSKRCMDCSSAAAWIHKSRECKIELVGEDAFFVTSQCIMLEGRQAVLETAVKIEKEYAVKVLDTPHLPDRVKELSRCSIDELTGIYDRRYVDKALNAALERCADEKRTCGLALVDVDYLGAVNDTWGHRAGDDLLIAIVDRILKNIRSDALDFLARYGDDEFCLYLDDIEPSDFERKLCNILRDIQTLSVEEWEEISTSVSIGGVAVSGEDRSCAKGCLKLAGERLILAKRRRNTAYVTDYLN